MIRTVFACALTALLCAVSLAPAASAKVFHSKEGALKLAFPDADSVKPMHLFLSEAQAAEVERASGTRCPSKLITLYVGEKAGQPMGFAMFDTHLVRTLPATFMTVLDLDGRIRSVHILAFHEPQEYLPSRGWLRQFDGKSLTSGLRVRQEVAGIAGATLSAFAVTKGLHRVLAIFHVALRGSVPQG